MEQLEKLRLDNGLRVLLLPVEGALSASVGVWIEAGSRYEAAAKQGISHFVEHMTFKGTAARTARQISEEMDLLGGGMNAYTTKEYTRFYAQTLAENARPAMELLADMLLHSRMEAEDVDLERGVILEEMAMYEDAGEDLAHEALCGAIWPDSPLGRPICGTRETVSAITPQDLLQYVAEEYTPGRMVAVAAGGYNREDILDCLQSTLGRLKPGAPRPAADTPAFTPGVVLRKKKFEQVSLELAVPGIPSGVEDGDFRYALLLFNFIAGGGASSRLFLRLREELGLAYSVYSTHYASKGAGLFTVSAAVSPKQQFRVLGEIRDILAGLAQGIGEEEFLRARAQIKSSFILGLETVAARATYVGRNELLEGRSIRETEVLSALDRLEPRDIERLAARLLQNASWALSAAGKVESKEMYLPFIQS